MNENLFGQLHGATKVASTGSATIFGVEVGLVTNVQDPQKLGRVKVAFPRLSGLPEGDWARVVQPAGGPGRGFYWLPEVNDEVLVAFEMGQPNRPYVIRSLWNAKDKPMKDAYADDNTTRMIQTKSGHQIALSDKDGEEKITICDGTGKRVLTFDVKAKKLLIEAKEGSVELKAQKKIRMLCEDLEVHTSKDAKLDVSKTFDLKVASDAAMKAGGTFTLKGSKVQINPSSLSVAALVGAVAGAVAGAAAGTGGATGAAGTGGATGAAGTGGAAGPAAGAQPPAAATVPPATAVVPTSVPAGSIAGRVSESAGAHPGVSGATVTLNTGQTATTDGSGNYSFTGLAAGSYQIQVRKNGFVNPTPATANVTVNAGQAATQNLQLTPVVLEIVDSAGNVLTGTQTRVIGERINLTVRTNPAGQAMTNIQWTLPGNRIKNYTQSTASATVTNLAAADLQTASVQFYWIAALAGGSLQVSATVAGTTINTSLTFNVLAPTGVSFKGEQCEVTLGPHFAYAGVGVAAYNAATGHFGIQWNASATAPAGGAGQIAITQLITRHFTRTRAGVNEHITSPALVLDDGLGIQYSGPQAIAAGAAATLSGNAYADSPGSQLTADTTVVNCSDQFQDYFMYRPSTPNSIWVTLAILNWSWSGSATAAPPPPPPPPPSGFVLGAHAPAAVTTVTGSASTAQPQWAHNLAPYNHWGP